VRWNGVLSSFFNVYCGVRQGGVLSPLLFNLYVDDLLCELKASKLGCCIKDIYVGCVMYADDILLLSASVITLQSMLSICSKYGRKHDIIFNCKKSVCMAVGSKWKTAISLMLLNDVPIPWVKQYQVFRHCASGRHQFAC